MNNRVVNTVTSQLEGPYLVSQGHALFTMVTLGLFGSILETLKTKVYDYNRNRKLKAVYKWPPWGLQSCPPVCY